MDGVAVGATTATEADGFAAAVGDHDRKMRNAIPPIANARTNTPPMSNPATRSNLRLTPRPGVAEAGIGGGAGLGRG